MAVAALVAASCGGDDDTEVADGTKAADDEDATGGAATITIDGKEFSFTPAQYNIDEEEATAVGNGETGDGVPFKGKVVIVTSGAGEVASITVGIGNDGITASAQPDDRPLYESSQIIDPVTYEISGRTVTGAGPLHDSNEVAAPQSETFPMTFDVTCSE